MRRLPPLLGTAARRPAEPDHLLAAAPGRGQLRDAGPDLSSALRKLPDTGHDLRASLSPLDQTCDWPRTPWTGSPTSPATCGICSPPCATTSPTSTRRWPSSPLQPRPGRVLHQLLRLVGPDDGNGKIFRILFLFQRAVAELADQHQHRTAGEGATPIPVARTGAKPNPHGDKPAVLPRIERGPR